MKITDEELIWAIVAIEKHVQQVENLLHSTIELQDSIGKFLSLKLPDLTPEERQRIQTNHMRGESSLDHLQAAAQDWRKQFDAFVKRIRERE